MKEDLSVAALVLTAGIASSSVQADGGVDFFPEERVNSILFVDRYSGAEDRRESSVVQEGKRCASEVEWTIEEQGNIYPISIDSQGFGFVEKGPAGCLVKVLQNPDTGKIYGEDEFYYYNDVRLTSNEEGLVFLKRGILKPPRLQH